MFSAFRSSVPLGLGFPRSLNTGGRYCAVGTESDTHANIFSDTNRYGDRYTSFNTKSYTYTTATPYTGASAVSAAFVPRLRTTTSN